MQIKSIKYIVLMIFILGISVFIISCGEDDEKKEAPTIEAADFNQLVTTRMGKDATDESANVSIVDVRSANTFKLSTVPYAKNLADAAAVEGKVSDKARRIVVFGDDDSKAEKVVLDLLDKSYTDVKLFKGGLTKWKEAGYWCEIYKEGFEAMKSSAVAVIDVRPPPKFEAGTIEGSVSIPASKETNLWVATAEEALAAYNKSDELIIFCQDYT